MTTYEFDHVAIRKRNRLPHWDARHAIYFVTFNLFDALPARRVREIREEALVRLELLTRERPASTPAERSTIERWVHEEIERYLDTGAGSCVLRHRDAASLVSDALLHFDGTRYDLLAWCVMPNHVHVVFTIRESETIAKILHSWKSFTAKQLAPRRDGSHVWQEDYFDRSVRNERHLERTIAYVLGNPAAAGLEGWPFVGANPERISRVVHGFE